MIVCLRECARVGQAVSNDLEMLNLCMLDICVAPEFPSASGTCTNNINILLTTSRGILSPNNRVSSSVTFHFLPNQLYRTEQPLNVNVDGVQSVILYLHRNMGDKV